MLGGFTIYRNDRSGDNNSKEGGGGVLLAIRNSLASELVLKSPSTESIFCRINNKNNPPTIVGCVYRPPDNNTEICNTICNEILKLKTKFKKSVFWVGGDFNLPDIDWENSEIKGYNYKKEINERFLDTFNDAGLCQMIDKPTRGENTLDIFLTNCPDLIKSRNIVPGIGDHEAVRIDSSLRLSRKKPSRRTIRLWNKVNLDNLKKDESQPSTTPH